MNFTVNNSAIPILACILIAVIFIISNVIFECFRIKRDLKRISKQYNESYKKDRYKQAMKDDCFGLKGSGLDNEN